MGDFDETFEKSGNNENEENLTKVKRQPRTKNIQFDLLMEFYKYNNQPLMDSVLNHQLWVELVGKLNSIGPPSHSVAEWKRIWSEHKYNKKRYRSETEESSQPIKKMALHETQNQSPELPAKNSTTDDFKHHSLAPSPQQPIEPFGEFIVQLPTVPDVSGFTVHDLFPSNDGSLLNVFDNVRATSDVLYDFQSSQVNSGVSESRIEQRLSVVIEKLDVVIDLLTELVKKK